MDASIANQVMTTTTNQLVFELSSIIITGIFGVLGYYVKKFLSTNEFVKSYNLYNEKTERVLENALAYAEAKSLGITAEQISKKQMAVSYIEKISPDIIKKEGDKLELMLDRKLQQMGQKYSVTQLVAEQPIQPNS